MKRLGLVFLGLSLAGAEPARAEAVRFRFVPADACGAMSQVPAGPNGAIGEQFTGFGLRPQPYHRAFRPNQMVTFRHPYNGRNVTIPMTLPPGTPQWEQLSDRIVYNYGSYRVEARFFPDGSVETFYNSGFLSPLPIP
jgi:hypothetical protein